MKKLCLLFSLLAALAGLAYAGEEYPLGPDSQRQAGVPQGMARSALHLFQDGEVAGIPRQSHDVKLASDFSYGGVVNVGEIREAQVFLNHQRRDELFILEDVDGCAFFLVRTFQRGNHAVLVVEVIDVAGQRARGHGIQGNEVTIARKAFKAGVGPVRDVKQLLSRDLGDSMAGIELTDGVAFAAPG